MMKIQRVGFWDKKRGRHRYREFIHKTAAKQYAEVEGTEEKLTSDQLLDLFVNGSIDAVDSKDMTSKYSIADFHIGSGEKNSYSIGEKWILTMMEKMS